MSQRIKQLFKIKTPF